MKHPIEIFFSYAHEDEELMNDVRRQLIVEERNGRIIKWHDRKIPPGSDWQRQIDFRLKNAAIILLFMSPHFIESKYCYEVEGQAALHRHETGEARVIPVILRPCLWDRSPFGKLQALPRDALPVSRWPDRDEACMEVAKGVMTVVDELLASRNYVQGGLDNSLTVLGQPSTPHTIFSDLSLPDDKFEFLYRVYEKSETDIFAIVEAAWIQTRLGLSQQRTISVGQFLDQNGFIKFDTWVQGIKILHKGVLKVDAELLGNNRLPVYVSENEIKKIEQRIQLRFTILQQLYKDTQEDTFKMVLHANLANDLGLDHHCAITQLLPYMVDEGWIKWRTNDSVTITELGIDRVRAMLTK